jgi:hypothetical protein
MPKDRLATLLLRSEIPLADRHRRYACGADGRRASSTAVRTTETGFAGTMPRRICAEAMASLPMSFLISMALSRVAAVSSR